MCLRHPLRIAGLCLLLSALGGGTARSQTPAGSWTLTGETDVGGRTAWGDDERGKFLEYRDLDDGVLAGFRLLADDATGRYFVRGQGENAGHDDQRYWLEGGRHGKLRVDAFVREFDHVFSTEARTLYLQGAGDRLQLPAGVQTRIEGAASPSTQLATELASAGRTDLELRWFEAGGGLDLQLTEAVRLHASYRLQEKDGERALGLGWGTPGGHFAVVPLEIDEQIHEVRAGAEWLEGGRSLSIEYLGSFFDNELHRALVDNPLVATDTASASSQAGLARSPDNSAHSLALSASTRLSLAFPARASGSLVYGLRLQDQRFLPHTVNSDPAFDPLLQPGLALSQGDLDGRVETLLANLTVDLDPTPLWDVDLRYRFYRYDNQSDEILFPEHVVNDDAVSASPLRSVANDYTVQKLKLSGRRKLGDALSGRLTYAWEHWHRSDDRQVRDTHEHGPGVRLDYRLSLRTTLQMSYDFRTRNGNGYDPFAYVDETLDPAGRDEARLIGELRALRKYDQADRDTHDLGVQMFSVPSDRLELSGSAGLQLADYRNSDFGLTDQQTLHAGFEARYLLHSRASLGAFYDFEALLYEQDSRWRPRSFLPGSVAVDDPLNNWSSRTRSRFHSGGLELDVALVPDRVELQLGAELHQGRERTTSSGPAGGVAAGAPTSSGDGGNALFFPEIEDRLRVLRAGVLVHLGEGLSLLAQYRYEDYDLDDDPRRQDLGPFLADSNVDGSGTVSPSTDVFLGDEVRGFQAHVFRLIARIRF